MNDVTEICERCEGNIPAPSQSLCHECISDLDYERDFDDEREVIEQSARFPRFHTPLLRTRLGGPKTEPDF